MAVTKQSMGSIPGGQEAELYTLTNDKKTEVKISTLGAAIVGIVFQDKQEIMQDVVLGYDTAEEYYRNGGHFGAVVGRSGNRIDKAAYTLNGKSYSLQVNDNENNLHSGPDYFGKRIWNVEKVTDDSVTLSLHDADGQQGYPGNFDCCITYTLTENNALRLHYEASCDQDTVANLTNHVYFNLSGHDSGSIEDTVLTLRAESYTPVRDHQAIPTGEVAPVKGTPMDFTSPRVIGQDIDSDFQQLTFVGGYDHNFALHADKGLVMEFGQAYSPKTGILMTCYTDLPGVQLYAGNGIKAGTKGKNGAVYNRRQGFCLETQYYPNAINQEGFAKPILKAGEKYDTVTVYQFSVK